MKKNILKTIMTFAFASLLYSGTVAPALSLRFNDIVHAPNNDLGTLTPTLTLGFVAEIQDGVKAGFDSDGSDSRIYVAFDYGTVGMGMNAAGDPQFTVGATYQALTGLGVSLDYVINNLAAGGDPNEIRLSMGINF